jgi:type IV conjugative transfer system coupling protein TraD
MSSASNSNFTRGAQLWAHNMRMIMQGIKNICFFGLACIFGLIVFRLSQHTTFQTIYYFIIKCYVDFKLSIGAFFYGKHQIVIDFYSINKGHFVHMRAEEYNYLFWKVMPYGASINQVLLWVKQDAFFEVVASFAVGCSLALILFTYRGGDILGIKKLRGSDLVTPKQLAKILRRAKEASKIIISGLPLVKDSETQHLLLTGTTGAGKTNMLKELIPQIRNSGDRAIIFDVTGEFVDRFYNPETDLILNPLVENSVSWLPWNDCHTDEEYNNLAAAFVDGESIKTDRYWEDAARTVLVEALKKQESTRSIESMLHVINRADLKDFCQYFSDTDAAGYVSREAEKGTASVRSTLASKVKELKYLKDKGDFSIKEWINGENRKGWLFVSIKPNDLDTLRPLLSAWANIAIKGMLDRPHSGENEKMWFVMDELPAMQKIPSLAMVLAQGRKYGACMVAGIQNIAQLERIYGSASSQELLDLFRTKFFFAVGDNTIAEYASKSLGEIEIDETKESLSYGSNTIRDGVNINSSIRMKRLVLPDEIKNLEPNSCFVKLCGNYPITKLKVDLQARTTQTIVPKKITIDQKEPIPTPPIVNIPFSGDGQLGSSIDHPINNKDKIKVFEDHRYKKELLVKLKNNQKNDGSNRNN